MNISIRYKKFGGVAQSGRAVGSYPACRPFKSDPRYQRQMVPPPETVDKHVGGVPPKAKPTAGKSSPRYHPISHSCFAYLLPVLAIISVSVLCLPAWGGLPAPSTSYDKSTYYEDTVTTKSGEVSVLVNRDDGKIGYFWSTDKSQWVDAGEYPENLQKIYANKAQLESMQSAMNQFHEESFQEHQGQ